MPDQPQVVKLHPAERRLYGPERFGGAPQQPTEAAPKRAISLPDFAPVQLGLQGDGFEFESIVLGFVELVGNSTGQILLSSLGGLGAIQRVFAEGQLFG